MNLRIMPEDSHAIARLKVCYLFPIALFLVPLRAVGLMFADYGRVFREVLEILRDGNPE